MSSETKYMIQEVIRIYKTLPEDAQQEVKKALGFEIQKPLVKQGFFKLRHRPTGLFYQVAKHMGSNVSKIGKVYSRINHVKAAYNPDKGRDFLIILNERSPLIKDFENIGHVFEKRAGYYGQVTIRTKASEWEIVEI